MKYSIYLFGGLILLLVVVIVLFARVLSLSGEIQSLAEKNDRNVATLQDSLKRVQAELATAKESAPGLGEYMTTMQLHMAKLWFAAAAQNWDLAQYEVGELDETAEGAQALHTVKNGVDISKVLGSVRETQIAGMIDSIKRKNQTDFQKAYDETLSACNGCHESAGYKFINIVRPTSPPVSNQKWAVASK